MATIRIGTDYVFTADMQSTSFDEDDPFVQYFSRFRIPMPRRTSACGIDSGFILSSDGYILTNAHLVEGADEATVMLIDQRKFKAKVVGRDRHSDIALLKIVARADCAEHRCSHETEGRPSGHRRALGVQPGELGNRADRLSDVAFAPGQPLRSVRPLRCRDHSAQFRRGAVRSRR